MDQHEIAWALEKFASDAGFEPEQPFYITHQFRVDAAEGIAFYSDEAHLYCETCAEDLLEKVFPFLPDEERVDHAVFMADSSSPEDSPLACATCGATLRHCLTDGCGVGQELWHYRENPIEPGDVISPDTAIASRRLSLPPTEPTFRRLSRSASPRSRRSIARRGSEHADHHASRARPDRSRGAH